MQPDNQNQNQNQNQNRLDEEEARLVELHRRRQHILDLIDQQEAAARDWNERPDIQDELRRRASIVNNTDHYYTGNRIHHLRTIQMVSLDKWNLLFGGPYATYIHKNAAEYGKRMIREATNRSVLIMEDLGVSLLLEENVRPGVHRVMFIIHANSHRAMCYGHMVCYDVADAGQQHQLIENMFDVNSNAIIERCNEYDILSLLAEEDEMQYLLELIFLQGFESQRFAENDPDHLIHQHMCAGILQNLLALDNHRAVVDVDVNDAAAALEDDDSDDDDAPVVVDVDVDVDAEVQYAIPPPPPINDFAQIYHFYNEYDNENYQQEAPARREGNDNDDEYPAAAAAADPEHNIIGYWFENDHRANEYLDIQEEHQRNRAAAGADAYLGEEYYNVIRG